MSDTQTMLTADADSPEVWQMYVKLMNKVNEIDDQIEAGSEASSTRKFTNEIVSDNESEWKGVSDKLSEMLTTVRDGNPETGQEPNMPGFVGSLYGIIRTLTKAYKEQADAWIKAQVDAMPKSDGPEASDEQKKQLSAARQELVKQLKTVVDMALIFGVDTSQYGTVDAEGKWVLPKRRGAVGARGKRELSYFTWQIDDVPMEGEEDSVAGVSKALGFDKVADFSAELRSQVVNEAGEKFDTNKPPSEFTFNIRGKEVSAQDTRLMEDEEPDETEPSVGEDAE